MFLPLPMLRKLECSFYVPDLEIVKRAPLCAFLQLFPRSRIAGMEDQKHQGRHVRLPPGEFGVQRFRLYRY